MTVARARLAVVVIGRNEGQRLVRCLRSVRAAGRPFVYVDSGSSDASVARAREAGAEVVELSPDAPFSAARARNEGFRVADERLGPLDVVQFVDGDCELSPGWLEAGLAALESAPALGAVCGRRRELHPERSVFNRLVDMEWDGAPGEVSAAGGDVMVRAEALRRVGGYNPSLVAGEDPDLGLRLRRAGYRILRLDRPMTRHDADLTRARQWWMRMVRSGHAYAERFALHGLADAEAGRRTASILAWALALPVAGLLLALVEPALAWLVPAAWLLLAARIARARRRRGSDAAAAILYAAACVVGKFAELQGVLRYARNRWLGADRDALIEYKGPENTT